MRQALNNLRLQLQKIDNDIIQVSWFDTHNGDSVYRIALPHMEQSATSVRERLREMTQQYMLDPTSGKTKDAMRRLLVAGNEMFEALFLATSDKEHASAAKDTYLALDTQGQLGLAIKVDPALTYPFALSAPLEEDFDTIVEDLTARHRAFWGLRHNLSVSAFGASISPSQAVGQPEYRALAAVNREVFDSAAASVTEAPERDFLDVLRKSWGSSLTFTFRDFWTASKAAGDDPGTKLRIAYLYGHASGDRFQLAATDDITASALATRLGYNGHRAHRQQTFIFLNGCDTAAEGERFAFTDLLRYPNISGLIGTEVRVPDRFAFRFALAFFRLVIAEGKTFSDAISILRGEHLPISLVYTLYATDGLSLVPAPSTEPVVFAVSPAVNFSMGKVKCD